MRRLRRRIAVMRLRLSSRFLRVPDRLIVAPTDLRGVDPHVCDEILSGRFPLAGRLLETDGKSPFHLTLPSRAFAVRLHNFSWLRHMRARKNPRSGAAARTIVDSWLSIHGTRIVGIAWEEEVTAKRVISWLSHSPVLLQGAERGFYRRFMRSLAFQIRYLQRTARYQPDGTTLFQIRIALAMATVAVPTKAATLKRAAQDLDREFDLQILPDGGHISRNPRIGLELLLDLLPLRQTYVNLGHDLPQKLMSGIDRMYPALRFFRHSNGDLALFNGASTTSAEELMSVLRYDETTGQPFKAMPHSNFQRLASGNTVILMDTGVAPLGRLSASAHAGCLSFEMSSYRHRFIVNAGSPKFADRRYVQMARATAAHSTVTLNDTSSSRFLQSDFIEPVMQERVEAVQVERSKADDGRDCVIATHDGYLSDFGLLHQREISLNATGTIITGRDRLLMPDGNDTGTEFDAVSRFHIHPAIDLYQQDRESVLLMAPDGEKWVFSCPGHEVVIAEDVFFADASGICASDQLEIAFSDQKPEIRWFLSRRS
ncbi:heparinase II/III family protein [Oryzifoliimicrobium ureilyticus]|uniref:heparinase II/III family protein n=1 Tax=Oryzifoliimicrobium ureilyticus TaxID=3113724 RepID=UPI003F6797D6